MALTKKTGNEIPRPQVGKTADKTRLVRFVDLNRTIDELNIELVAKDEAIESLQYQIDNLPDGTGGATPTEITPAEIQTLISTESLVPYSFYLIKDAEPDLYGGTFTGCTAISGIIFNCSATNAGFIQDITLDGGEFGNCLATLEGVIATISINGGVFRNNTASNGGSIIAITKGVGEQYINNIVVGTPVNI